MLEFESRPSFLERFAVTSFSVTQALGQVGTVSLSLHPKHFRSEPETETHRALQGSLGEDVNLTFGDWTFHGIVAAVQTSPQSQGFEVMISDALSELAAVHGSQAFAEQTLGDIMSALVPGGLDVEYIDGCDSTQIRLAIQFQESNLTFLRRVIARLGGQLWCAGGKLRVATDPPEGSAVLRLGRDIGSFTISTTLGPESVNVDSVPYANDNSLESSAIDAAAGEYGDVQKEAIDKRKGAETASTFHIVHEDSSFDDTTHLGRAFLRSRADGRILLTGTSRRPLVLGEKIQLENASAGGEVADTEVCIVRSMAGQASVSGGDAEWTFEAVNPEALLDARDFKPDRVVTSAAIVAEDADLQNRIKVYFPWDKNECTTPWLRMTTPSWGDSHSFYIPPKIGDTVLVVWGQRDMDPVVLGCLSAGVDVGESDKTVVIQTVDGQTITVESNAVKIRNEAEGGGTEIEMKPDRVVIKTPNNQEVTMGSSSILLDNGGMSSIEIQSSKIVINSAEVEITSSSGASVKLSGPQVSVNNGALEVI